MESGLRPRVSPGLGCPLPFLAAPPRDRSEVWERGQWPVGSVHTPLRFSTVGWPLRSWEGSGSCLGTLALVPVTPEDSGSNEATLQGQDDAPGTPSWGG